MIGSNPICIGIKICYKLAWTIHKINSASIVYIYCNISSCLTGQNKANKDIFCFCEIFTYSKIYFISRYSCFIRVAEELWVMYNTIYFNNIFYALKISCYILWNNIFSPCVQVNSNWLCCACGNRLIYKNAINIKICLIRRQYISKALYNIPPCSALFKLHIIRDWLNKTIYIFTLWNKIPCNAAFFQNPNHGFSYILTNRDDYFIFCAQSCYISISKAS